MVCATSLVATITSTAISSYNYPGGHAMLAMNRLLVSGDHHFTNTTVHLDVYTRLAGATNLLHQPNLARLDKSENITKGNSGAYRNFQYLVVHEPELHTREWQKHTAIQGWAGLRRQRLHCSSALSGQVSLRQCLVPQTGESISHWLKRISPVRMRIRDQVHILRKSL